MQTSYKPIDCGYHDHIEAAASRRELVNLHFITASGEQIATSGIIENIETSGGEEFLQLSSGEEIRLDRIVKLNDLTFPGYE